MDENNQFAEEDSNPHAYDSDVCPEEETDAISSGSEVEEFHECTGNAEETNTSIPMPVPNDKHPIETMLQVGNLQIVEQDSAADQTLMQQGDSPKRANEKEVDLQDQVKVLSKEECDKPGDIANPVAGVCDLCKDMNNLVPGTHYCTVCEEYYCNNCTTSHRAQKATRDHNILAGCSQILFVCNLCSDKKTKSPASASCKVCCELYCSSCAGFHVAQKATRSHDITQHKDLLQKVKCEPCTYINLEKSASYLCIDCDEVLCFDCCSLHQRQKATKNHVIAKSSSVEDKTVEKKANQTTEGLGPKPAVVARSLNMLPMQLSKGQENIHLQPGKPYLLGERCLDSVCITWDPPSCLFPEHSYQIRYKENKEGNKWTTHSEQSATSSLKIGSLKSNTNYVFQVRMVSNDQEGPFSEVSELVETIESAAARMMEYMYEVERPDVHIPLKRLPLKEIRKARNVKEKTRKLIIGEAKKTNPKEKTIMLVGATGTGKSTLVDGMVNYILGVSWNDPYRVTLIDLEEDEENRGDNQAVSQTQWITTYRVNPLKGSRLDYSLNIIDTPGFGDTRGIERDREIVEQIRGLFSRQDDTGVVFLDAVCFLIKSPDARLTPTQQYIFNAIMSLFGNDIEENFCMLVTFADGKRPPVLAALKEANLPYELFFPFNNSGLFAENVGADISSFSQMFWEMGCKSFESFFDKLKTMTTKSLQQTRDVLEHREQIEINMENLLPKLDAGLIKVEEMRIEQQILEDFKTVIDANSDFKYTVQETEQKQIDLPPGQHVTNCLNCNVTCHKNCRIPNDEDKKRCKAMNKDGYCQQCFGACFWNMHRNTPYIFEFITVVKEKTYTEKLEKYRRAKDEKVTRETVVARMEEEILQLENEIMELMGRITECNNILKQIALRPDPLTVAEHIDLLIESEKMEKRPGFQLRINALNRFRKRATIREDVERFRTCVTDTKFISARVVYCIPQPAQRKSKKDKFGVFQGVVDYFRK